MPGQAVASNENETGRVLTLSPGEGRAIWFLHDLMVVKATAESTGGAYGLVESVIPPGFSPPMHIHHREDEAFWVLEGELTYCCDGRTFRTGPGGYVFLPRGLPHSFIVEGDTPGRMLTLLTPGGGEGFFIDAGRPAEWIGLPPAEPLDSPKLASAGQRYGLELVGPPLRRAGH